MNNLPSSTAKTYPSEPSPGRCAGVGRKSCEAYGQLAGDGAEELTPVRVPLVVFEREK